MIMKKLFLILILFMSICRVQAQIKNLEYWRNDSMLKYFPDDLDTLSKDIDNLNTFILLPFKKELDACREKGIKREKKLRELIDTDISEIRKNLDSIKGRRFYNPPLHEFNKDKKLKDS